LDDLSANPADLTGKEDELLEGAGKEPAGDLENLPAEEAAIEPAEADLADLATGPAEADLATEPAEADLADLAAEEPAGAPHAEEEEEEEKEPSKLPVALEVAAVIVVPVAIIALALMQIGDPWTWLYVFLLACVPYALWKGRATNTVFTVFLGCVLAAELTAIFCLLKEFQRYGYDVSGRAAKQKVSMTAPNYPNAIDPGSLA
jgi:hypothetical protein